MAFVASMKNLWERWKVIAHVIGDFQARVLLSIMYLVVIGPFAIVARLVSDPLRLRQAAPTWLPHPDSGGDAITIARRQF